MERHHDPGVAPEDEGIPDLQDGTPEQQRAEDPEQMPVPGDVPVAADRYGVTAAEQAAGESLDDRLAQEVPEEQVDGRAPLGPDETGAARPVDEPAGRLVQEDEGVRGDTEKDMVGTAAGEETGLSAEEAAVRVEPEGPDAPG